MTRPLLRPTPNLTLQPRMNTQQTTPRLIKLTNRKLQQNPNIPRKHQRSLQRQLPHNTTPNPLTNTQSQIKKHSPRQQHTTQHRMIRKPRMTLQRHTPSKQPLPTISQLNHRTQQRMTSRRQTSRSHITHTQPSIQPKPLPLKSISRQPHTPRTRTPKQHTPINLNTTRPHLSQRTQKTLRPTLPTTQRTHHHPIPRNLKHPIHTLLHTHRQHRMRTNLNKRPIPIPKQHTNNPLKLNRLTQIAIPILTIQLRHINQPTRHRREKRNITPTRHNPSTPLQQLPPNPLNRNRMRRIINRNLPRPQTLQLTLPKKLPQRPTITRNHHRRRPIHRRNPKTITPTPPSTPTLKTLLKHPQRHTNRNHPTQPSQTHQRTTTQRHHPRRIPKRKPTRHTRSSNLTLRMTHHHPRTHTTRTPQPRQRHHHRKQHRLNHIHPIKPRSTTHTPQHILQRPTNKLTQRLTTNPHPLSKHRRTIQQPQRHTHPLRTLTRKQKHNTPTTPTTRHHTPRHHTLHNTHTQLPRHQPRQTTNQTPNPSTQNHRTMLKHRTTSQRQPHIPNPQPTTNTPHKLTQTPSIPTQRTHTPTRQHPRHHTNTNGPPSPNTPTLPPNTTHTLNTPSPTSGTPVGLCAVVPPPGSRAHSCH